MSIGSKITRIYGGFRGVDFRGEEINLVRCSSTQTNGNEMKIIPLMTVAAGRASVLQ